MGDIREFWISTALIVVGIAVSVLVAKSIAAPTGARILIVVVGTAVFYVGSIFGLWAILRVLSRNANDAIVFTDTRTAKAITNHEFLLPSLICVAFSPTSLRIGIEKEDAVHIFNPQTGKELATLISAYDGRDWLVTTPDGYYDGSPGGQSLIRWRVGEAEYPSDHFEKQLHRPDMVAKILQERRQD